MEYSTRDEGCEKKIKYVPPELISLDKDKGAEDQPQRVSCTNGSGAVSGSGSGSNGDA